MMFGRAPEPTPPGAPLAAPRASRQGPCEASVVERAPQRGRAPRHRVWGRAARPVRCVAFGCRVARGRRAAQSGCVFACAARQQLFFSVECGVTGRRRRGARLRVPQASDARPWSAGALCAKLDLGWRRARIYFCFSFLAGLAGLPRVASDNFGYRHSLSAFGVPCRFPSHGRNFGFAGPSRKTSLIPMAARRREPLMRLALGAWLPGKRHR